MTRPLLLLDVDGVIIPFGAEPPAGYEHQNVGGYDLIWSDQHRDYFEELTPLFDLVWATTWEGQANYLFAPLLGLPELPVIHFEHGTGETWKLPCIQEFVGDRPFAWIDDEIFPDAFAWAESRDTPALLIATKPSIGLSREHIDALLAFAR
jgi:hypothetical protein